MSAEILIDQLGASYTTGYGYNLLSRYREPEFKDLGTFTAPDSYPSQQLRQKEESAFGVAAEKKEVAFPMSRHAQRIAAYQYFVDRLGFDPVGRGTVHFHHPEESVVMVLAGYDTKEEGSWAFVEN